MSETAAEYLIIECSAESVQEITDAFNKMPGLTYRANSLNPLDGDAATWIVVATLTIQAIPHLTNLLSLVKKEEPTITIEYEGVKYTGPLSKAKTALETIKEIIQTNLESKDT